MHQRGAASAASQALVPFEKMSWGCRPLGVRSFLTEVGCCMLLHPYRWQLASARVSLWKHRAVVCACHILHFLTHCRRAAKHSPACLLLPHHPQQHAWVRALWQPLGQASRRAVLSRTPPCRLPGLHAGSCGKHPAPFSTTQPCRFIPMSPTQVPPLCCPPPPPCRCRACWRSQAATAAAARASRETSKHAWREGCTAARR